MHLCYAKLASLKMICVTFVTFTRIALDLLCSYTFSHRQQSQQHSNISSTNYTHRKRLILIAEAVAVVGYFRVHMILHSRKKR